jgi:hypothetical protein
MQGVLLFQNGSVALEFTQKKENVIPISAFLEAAGVRSCLSAAPCWSCEPTPMFAQTHRWIWRLRATALCGRCWAARRSSRPVAWYVRVHYPVSRLTCVLQLNTFRDRGLALFVSITYENSRESLFGTTPARFTYRSVAGRCGAC